MPLYKVLIANWQRIDRDDLTALLSASGQTARLNAVRHYVLSCAFDSYTLRAEDPETVFQRLNVCRPPSYKLRPLSCGDLVIDLDSHNAFVCAPLTWHSFTQTLATIALPEGFWTLTTCPDCNNARFIHCAGEDGGTIQACDTCSPHLSDTEANDLHDAVCGCRHSESISSPDLDIDLTDSIEG